MNRPTLLSVLLAFGLLAFFVMSFWLPSLRSFGEGAMWTTGGVLVGYHARAVDDRRKRRDPVAE